MIAYRRIYPLFAYYVAVINIGDFPIAYIRIFKVHRPALSAVYHRDARVSCCYTTTSRRSSIQCELRMCGNLEKLWRIYAGEMLYARIWCIELQNRKQPFKIEVLE